MSRSASRISSDFGNRGRLEGAPRFPDDNDDRRARRERGGRLAQGQLRRRLPVKADDYRT